MTNVGTYIPKISDTRFVVKNIAPHNKTVRAFQCPIRNGATKDLLFIPGISEADIRHSLLKGELLLKLKFNELIIVDTNIDLLQFDLSQKEFLIAHGANGGLEVVGTGSAILNFAFKQGVSLSGTQNGVNRVFTTPDKFLNGPLGNNEFRITVKHNGKVLVDNVDYIVGESGGVGTGFDAVTFISFIPTDVSILVVDYVVEV